MEKAESVCRECRYAFLDGRCTDYRRDAIWFCRRKGAFFSRNYRVSEGTRIDPDAPACPYFKGRKTESSQNV